MERRTDPHNLNRLLPEEKAELSHLFLSWIQARLEQQWELADRLRLKIWYWDSSLCSDERWHPVFEYNLNRQRRAFLRMRRYGVDVYPFELKEA